MTNQPICLYREDAGRPAVTDSQAIAENLGQTYWGLPWVRARAELMREQFGFECWR